MRLSLMAAIGCLVALVVPLAATASTVDDAVKALEASTVYVAPGTEGTNSETTGVLLQQLSGGDNIVIVMLPASTLEESEEDLPAMAKRIHDETGGEKIVGLSVGSEKDRAVGYSALLPPGVATELMNAAIDVSTNSSETLSTFITNVHDWQAQNPEATASKPASKEEGQPWWVYLIGGGALGFLMIGLVLAYTSGLSKDPESHVSLKRSPDSVRDILEKVLRLRQSVEDHEMRSLLMQVCRDTEEYFLRMHRHSAKHELDADTDMFVEHLLSVEAVLEQYIDIQNNPRYFYDPDGELAKGKEGIAGFAESVLDSVKRRNRSQLSHFNVNTDILSAQRYS